MEDVEVTEYPGVTQVKVIGRIRTITVTTIIVVPAPVLVIRMTVITMTIETWASEPEYRMWMT
jgi:hypothetical protein